MNPMSHVRVGSAGMALAALVALGSGAAQAAPQALALVATHGKVALACAGADCSAELTSFCLDAGRHAPPKGTAYDLAGSGEILLTGTTADGRVLSLDARSQLRFASARRHLAVRVSIDRAALEAAGVTAAEVEIAEHVALLPAPRADDPNPITEGEAALFSGPLRELGARIVDGNGERMQAARVTARLINLMPDGKAAKAAAREGESEALWRRATAAKNADSLSPAARARARGAFELCRYVGTVGGSASLRRCLQDQHDGMVEFLNSKFWDAVQSGT